MALMATILGNGHGAQAEGIVPTNQVIQFGPFFNGSLSPGVYSVEVDMAETAESDSIFGGYWQGLTGPAVIATPGTLIKMASQKFQFKINTDGSVTNPFPAQPVPQAETHSAVAPEPALSFQPSPESTDIAPAPVALQQETSGSPSASQTTGVTRGQTPDQVVAILGPPISITTGAKHVYTYPHVMIVFIDGKVSEIRQIH
jgi:hypothetical protein